MDGTYKVLVVEDDSDQANLIQQSLLRFDPGFRVETATSGKACLRKLNANRYQAVVLDVHLPDLNSLSLLSKITSNGHSTPVVVVSGRGSEKIAVEALKKGACDYLVKDSRYLSVLPKVVKATIENHHRKAASRKASSRYRHIFQKAHDCLCVVDLKHARILESNAKADELLGYTQEELSRLDFPALFPQDQRQRVQTLLKRAASQGLDIDDSLSIRTRDGESIPVETQVSLIGFEGEAHLFCNVREIGERRRLQTLILNSKRRLQSTFDGIRDFIYQVDKDYEIVIANKAFAAACGTKPEDLVGKKCFEVCYQRTVPCEVCPVAKPFSSQERDAVEKYHNDDIVELYGYPILDEQGEVDSVVVYGRNVTEKRMLEKSLIQSEKLATIGLLASGIAHEIRNPLNIIETARYYIEEFAEEPAPDIRAKLEIIRKNVKRASKIINNLLEFSRQSEHEREKIDLSHLISNTISLIGKELEAKNIEFSMTSEKDCFAYFSVDSLKQVVLNLIINAIQAMPEGGRLNIEIRNTGADTVDLRIADTGVGIPEEHLQQIFAPFFTTKRASEGTGLGLYISKMIIEREGGAIRVESRVKRGTAFTLTLPRTAPESETQD